MLSRNLLRGPVRSYRGIRRLGTNTGSTKGIPLRWASSGVAFVAVAGALFWTKREARLSDVPELDLTPTNRLMVEPGPSDDEVTRTLSQGSYSHTKGVTSLGISRYDGAQLASNNPCEDRYVHGKFLADWGSHCMAWGVFDGHGGGETAELLKKQLLSFVRHRLSQVGSPEDESLIQNAVIQGFVDLEDLIVKTALEQAQSDEPLKQKVKKLLPAFAGSCALLSLYDSRTQKLHVACTGDSRAVMGRRTTDGKWQAVPLSVDQNGSNEDEIARINSEHPNETGIAKDGRILGIMCSRAFGDSRWRYPQEVQEDFQKRFYGPAPLKPRYDVRTPPYLTAAPVVTTTKISPDEPSFLIMATDGLWDMLSSQQAVDMVGEWIKSRSTKEASIKPESEPIPAHDRLDFGRFWNGKDWKFVEEKRIVVDKNAAVHLVRNSLGGGNHELVAARLAYSGPSSREVRDDITVQVVFFEKSLDEAG